MEELKKMPTTFTLYRNDGKKINVQFKFGSANLRGELRAIREKFDRQYNYSKVVKVATALKNKSTEELSKELADGENSELLQDIKSMEDYDASKFNEGLDKMTIELFRAMIKTDNLQEEDKAELEKEGFWQEQDLMEMERVTNFFRRSNRCF